VKSLAPEDRKRIEEGIRLKYARVARTSGGNFQYPTGEAGLKGLNYNTEILKKLPKDVFVSYCGVGNPFSLWPINEGEAVLDVGCGAGVDTLIAAMMVGPHGRVVGIDLIPEMLARSTENLRKTSLNNVSFQETSAEDLPFEDGSFDAVISNGVFNLIPDKLKALEEIFRVLKPLGRLMIADQVLTVEPPGDTRSMVVNWAK
jgi:SAM-dependent methyltransferase